MIRFIYSLATNISSVYNLSPTSPASSITTSASIIHVCDVYDALVSKRCYKEKMSFEEANKVILDSMGTHFDPALRKYFEEARPEIEEYYKSQEE